MPELEAIPTKTDAEVIRDLATAGAEIRHVDGCPVLIAPEGYQVHDLEHLLDRPRAIRQNVSLLDEASFVDYWGRYKDKDSALFASAPKEHRVSAVFDYHRKNLPGRCQHKSSYTCPLSSEWVTWTGSDGKSMDQAAFARFIEDNLPDIVEPRSAEILEVARSLQAKKSVHFVSGVRLDNGQVDFTYQEQIQGETSKGKIAVPETFTLGISPFYNGPPYKITVPPYKITARFRYRIRDAKLAMWYDLLRPDKALEDAYHETCARIAEACGVGLIFGVIG
jgi:uncharacterized protein YfdQ (DUF2303 family)